MNPDVPVTRNTPPTFLLQAENDPVDSVTNSLVYYIALKNVDSGDRTSPFAGIIESQTSGILLARKIVAIDRLPGDCSHPRDGVTIRHRLLSELISPSQRRMRPAAGI